MSDLVDLGSSSNDLGIFEGLGVLYGVSAWSKKWARIWPPYRSLCAPRVANVLPGIQCDSPRPRRLPRPPTW
jgi:hypothetical protein